MDNDKTYFSEQEYFDECYLNNVKKLLKRAQSFIKGLDKETSINVLIRIEDMQAVVDYCEELGIMNKVTLRDIADKDKVLEEGEKSNDVILLEDALGNQHNNV